jgi:chemotaxis protein methyltransferase CheR
VPPALRQRYFHRNGPKRDGMYRIADEVRELVTFRRLNLSMPPFPMAGPLDAVFCRNVMIYFDNEVRKRLLDDIHRLLRPGGYLMVGHSESLMGIKTEFRQVSASIYIK